MNYTINLLDKKSINRILEIYGLATFKTGLMTSPNNRDRQFQTEQKNLLDMVRDEGIVGYETECCNILDKNIIRSTQFYDHTCPKKYSKIKFLEYRQGMYYKEHNDSYMMGSIRSDFSCTVFLNDPTEYEGGELVIRVGDKDIEYKLEKGQAVIYQTGLSHQVKEVISGSRKVAVFWVESCIQDTRILSLYQQFCLLHENYNIKQSEGFFPPGAEFGEKLHAFKNNLLRNFVTL